MRTISQDLAFRVLTTPYQFATVPTDLTFVSLVEARRAALVLMPAALTGAVTVAVIEATDDAGTDAQVITGLSQSYTDTQDGLQGVFEVLDSDLSDGYTHVTLRVTPAAANTFAAYALLGDFDELPASNTTTDGVAFVDRLA